MWKRAWVSALDHRDRRTGTDVWPEAYRLLQNEGRGLLMQGTRDWHDYRVTARLKPHMCKAGGVAVRVQGLQRYYALLCDGERLRLIKTLDGDTVLAETAGGWTEGSTVELGLEIKGSALIGYVDGRTAIEASDPDHTFDGGGIALFCEEGRIGCDRVEVSPV